VWLSSTAGFLPNAGVCVGHEMILSGWGESIVDELTNDCFELFDEFIKRSVLKPKEEVLMIHQKRRYWNQPGKFLQVLFCMSQAFLKFINTFMIFTRPIDICPFG